MASEQDKGVDDQGQNRNLTQRSALNDAYAALLGQQNIQTWSAFTFEEAIDAQIEAIEGASTNKRPNQTDRVNRIENDLLAAISQLKETPPEQFLEPDADKDVNTERGDD